MKKWLIAGLLLCGTHPAYALLSPLNQSLEEIKSIVQSAEIENKFPQGQSVVSIRKADSGYLLTTQELQMRVDIQYLPSSYPGRQQFSLVFHAPTPIQRP